MKKNYKSEVGVIGTGFVGGSVIKWFKGCDFYSLDKGDWDKVDRQKYIFMCLPTPYNKYKGFELAALEENIARLSGHKIIIIKSTLLPGTTEKFAEKYPQHKFFFNPEFLTARIAWKDFIKPKRQIVGYVNKKDKRIATKILDMLPLSEAQFLCSASEAEMVKIVSNCYLATRVVLANQFYDYCENKGVDYEKTIKMVTSGDRRIEPSHWEIWHEGYRGYSGFCFPKDMGAMIYDSGSELLKKAHELNDKYFKMKK